MPMFTPEKALRSIRRTPVILSAILRDVTVERGQTMTDGPGGWSAVETVGHLYDWEQLTLERTQQMLHEDVPVLAGRNQETLVKERDYAHQDVHIVLSQYVEVRKQFIALLEGLSEDQWERRGIHPQFGSVTITELATNAAVHDVNHIEQVARTLGLAEALG